MVLSEKTRKMVALKREYNELLAEYRRDKAGMSFSRLTWCEDLHAFFYPKYRYMGWINPLTGERLDKDPPDWIEKAIKLFNKESKNRGKK
jgi:hypothetical protein